MIKPLRTYHYYLWRIWMVLLPIGFAAALWAIPKNQVQTMVKPAAIEAPVSSPVSQFTSANYEVSLRRPEQGKNYQLEVMLKQELTAPTCLVYIHTDADLLIGQLSQTGTYYFDVPVAVQNYKQIKVTFQDPIHDQIITTINLSL